MLTRHQEILEILAGKENVSVGELSNLLDVSEVTIRTDLNNLVKQGKVTRTHGGARLIEERLRQEYTFQTRKNLNLNKKQKIGEAASQFVNSLDSILLDASTTALALAHALRKRNELKDVTVIPTGIWTAIELMGCQNINVLLPGGYLRHTSGSIMGLPTNDFLKDLIVQKAFLGAWGISYETGLTDTNLIEIELKKFVVNKVNEVIVLLDGSKFNQSGLASYGNINQISKIITDSSAPPEEIKKFRKAGIEVIIADSK
jgi:DeoR/GlpR family transcriptional regulator of sugar metabolism